MGVSPLRAQEAQPSFDTSHTEEIQVPEPGEKAMEYYRSGNILWVVNQIWGLGIPLLFLFTGFSARLRTWASRLGRNWYFTIALFFLFYAVIGFVIDLPLDYYQSFYREHAYGLSNQSLYKWFTDDVKSLGISILGGALFLWVPYLMLKASPHRWWIYTGLLSIPFAFFMLLVSPIWISPLFNDFGSMQNKELEGDILDLAARAGIDADRVFEVNKSEDTNTSNAYVTGFLSTRRIVLWDTTLKRLNREEVLFVMAHEMGHYALSHNIQGVLFYSLLTVLTLFLIYRFSGRLLMRFGNRFGFTELHDVASLPLLIFLMGFFSLFIDPMDNAYSRFVETEADRFALELTRDNRSCATAFIKIQEENLANPNPGLLYTIWRSSHPSIGQRVEFCNRYRPWEEGEPLKYDHYFH